MIIAVFDILLAHSQLRTKSFFIHEFKYDVRTEGRFDPKWMQADAKGVEALWMSTLSYSNTTASYANKGIRK
jgi:hypothetical protein